MPNIVNRLKPSNNPNFSLLRFLVFVLFAVVAPLVALVVGARTKAVQTAITKSDWRAVAVIGACLIVIFAIGWIIERRQKKEHYIAIGLAVIAVGAIAFYWRQVAAMFNVNALTSAAILAYVIVTLAIGVWVANSNKKPNTPEGGA